MIPLQTDMSIYKKLDLEKPAIGMKYLFNRPEGIKQLDKSLAFCEMIKEAQQRNEPFYFSKENEDCAGKNALGMQETSAAATAGQIGGGGRIFQDDRANSNLIYSVYENFTRPAMGTINYVAYAQVDRLTFEPDLLVIVGTARQAEIVMRAMAYTTGELYRSVVSCVFACASLYVYPFQTGKVNYVVTGMTFGMRAKEVFPEGLVLISIPYHWIPAVTYSLNVMTWVPEAFSQGREKFIKHEKEVMDELKRDMINH
ncbi:MAG: DUF169 domain-containing protein [Dehalococcoidales bacterium]|nr:DUF169 domain-containing protein [Dehalococcoidales bacterium]